MAYCSGGKRCFLTLEPKRSGSPDPEFVVALMRNARRFGFDELLLDSATCGELFSPARLAELAVQLDSTVALASFAAVATGVSPFLLLPADLFLDVNLLALASPLAAGCKGRVLRTKEGGRLGAAWLNALQESEWGVDTLLEGGDILQEAVDANFAIAAKDLHVLRRRPAVFFDRDGVLNHDCGYPSRPEDLVWNEGAQEAVRRINDAGGYVFVVTNQSGIGRGYFDAPTVLALHRHMNDQLAMSGAHIDDFRHCPHAPGQGCDCRKPAPGMVLALARDWPVDMEKSVLVGDKESDIGAAVAAGIRGERFRGGSLLDFVAPFLEAMFTK